MTRHPYKAFATFLIAFLALGSDASPEPRPNVVFITIDDLNDWVGPLGGHPQSITPNFDRLASRGVTFRNAHCSIPICSASRSAFMTGLLPEKTGVFSNGNSFFDIDPDIQTIPEHLADQGYQTHGAGKLFHGRREDFVSYFHSYGPGTGNQGGPFTREELDTLKQNPSHRVDRGPGQLKALLPLNGMPDDRRDGVSRNNSFDWGPVDVPASEMPDGEIARWAARTLSQTSEKPFLVAAGFYRPHQPLFAPKEYFEKFDPETIQLPEILPDDLEDLPFYAQRLARYALTAGTHQTVLEHGQWEEAVLAYLACVTFIDDQLGLILDALEQSPAARNTWIVLLSDHGYHLGEKEHWGKFTPWSESTRVPLIIVPPSGYDSQEWARGRSVDTPVSLIDLYPTLVELCGIAPPGHDLDGQSLAPLLKTDYDPSSSDRYAITSNGRGTHAVVKGKYRYIRYFDGSEELYDRIADPHEFHNLSPEPQFAELKAELRGLLPSDPAVKRFVRYQDLKIIFFADPSVSPVVFEIAPGTGSGGGIGETKDVSKKHSALLDKIAAYLDQRPDLPTHLTVTDSDL
ncbi:sulfatase [Pelagicoccus sp. SDUM812005]|uniref:sulfatase n=1 Tax=Pelagicoccus sp. SDUM812005 TaxID=3041257 RepID=UPI00280DEF9A|nr:sulfatase [Pelagicoccus sp. SDUM812005]MDQ8183608.1 sulfatase [Pelagicoccus sp. SDUM812005]